MKNNEHNFDNEPNLPFDENGKSPFGLPSDYFSSFEDKLKKRIETENELSEFPLLFSIKKENVFETPSNYFIELENKVEIASELSSYAKLYAVKKPLFSSLDANYTEQLSASLHYKIELLDELKAYRTLYHIDKVNSFAVDQTYFEDLSLRVKDRLHSVIKDKVSLLDKILDFILGKKLALAFSALLIITIAVYFNSTSTKNIIENSDCQTLACLEKHEILNNNAISNFDEDQLMDLVDVGALDKQLKNETMKIDTLQQEQFILDNVNTDQLLEEL